MRQRGSNCTTQLTFLEAAARGALGCIRTKGCAIYTANVPSLLHEPCIVDDKPREHCACSASAARLTTQLAGGIGVMGIDDGEHAMITVCGSGQVGSNADVKEFIDEIDQRLSFTFS